MQHPLDTVLGLAGPGVIFRDFGDEMVVANLDSGIFFSLGGAAPAIWTAVTAGHTGRQVAAAYAAADAVATGAIAALLATLLQEALLAPAPAPLPSPPPGSLPGGAFVPPLIERFDDLQGLLLVDPIHDVGEAGWPAMAPTATLAG